jgi:hypothetical protein
VVGAAAWVGAVVGAAAWVGTSVGAAVGVVVGPQADKIMLTAINAAMNGNNRWCFIRSPPNLVF